LLNPTREQEQGVQKSFILVAIAMLLLPLPSTPSASQTAARNRDGVGPRNQTMIVVDAGGVKAHIALSDARAFSGQRMGVIVNFDIAPGWHVYGKPLPEEYTPTDVTFDKDLVSGQNLEFPKPTPVKFELLGETLPVYQGRFKAVGDILLRQKLVPGERRLGGTLSFQQCNDNLCKMPQQVRFQIPLRIDSQPPATPG
jgi:DsbC/DsbD-like thiol-disulfide interchange protein